MKSFWRFEVNQAVMDGDSVRLGKLLANANGELLHDPNDNHWIPLILAIREGHYGIAQQLLNAGADVEALDWCNKSALIWAVIRSNSDMCRLLIKYGANPNNFTCLPCKTALYYATSQDKYNIVSLLLEHGAEIRVPGIPWENQWKSPIAQAVAESPRMTKLFLDHCRKFDILVPIDLLLDLAIENDTEESALLLAQHGFYPVKNEPDVFGPFSCCFNKAAHYGLTKLMSYIVELNPHYLQEKWLIQKGFPNKLKLKSNFISWLVEYRKQPSSLQILCKSVILSQMGMNYVPKVNMLPLPQALKRYLHVVKSAYIQA